MTHERVYQLVIKEDEITWQSILLELVKKGELDPWNVDISLLAQKYIETIKELQEMNLFISGKMLLASAILLKMKSEKLLVEGIGYLDNLMYPSEEDYQEFEMEHQGRLSADERPRLTIRNPQARKRRVTITDLMDALEKALDVSERKVKRWEQKNWIPDLKVPEKPIDMSILIEQIYTKVKEYLLSKEKVFFSELVRSDNKKEKILTFIPLLHLACQCKVDLYQTQPFEDIEISIYKPNIEEVL